MKKISFLSLLIFFSCMYDKNLKIEIIDISGIPYDLDRNPITEVNSILFINDTIGFLAGDFNDIQPINNDENIFAKSEYSAFIYKTTDGGKTFKKLSPFGVGRVQYVSESNNGLYAIKIIDSAQAVYKSIVYHSTNEGESWEIILEKNEYVNTIKHFSDASFVVVMDKEEGKVNLIKINGKRIKRIVLPFNHPLYEFMVYENYLFAHLIDKTNYTNQIIKYDLTSQEYELISLPKELYIIKMLTFHDKVKIIGESDDEIIVFTLENNHLQEDFIFQKSKDIGYMEDYFESSENRYLLLSIGSAYKLISINKENQKQEEIYFEDNYFIKPYFNLSEDGKIKIWFFGSAYRDGSLPIFQKFSE